MYKMQYIIIKNSFWQQYTYVLFQFSVPLTQDLLELGSKCHFCFYPMCSKKCKEIHSKDYLEECKVLAKLSIENEELKVNQPHLVS